MDGRIKNLLGLMACCCTLFLGGGGSPAAPVHIPTAAEIPTTSAADIAAIGKNISLLKDPTSGGTHPNQLIGCVH